jgi:hypothetical protein
MPPTDPAHFRPGRNGVVALYEEDSPIGIPIAPVSCMSVLANTKRMAPERGPSFMKAADAGGKPSDVARSGMAGDERRFSIPEAVSINGSFRRCTPPFFLPLDSSSKMPSNFELFHLSPNFDARVRSTASLHRHI